MSKAKRVAKQRDPHTRRMLSRALNILDSENPIREINGSGIFRVPSETDGAVYYAVNLRRKSCECKDWRKRGGECKHITAAKLYRAKVVVTAPPAVNGRQIPHPRHYERVRAARRPCIREALRCISDWVNEHA